MMKSFFVSFLVTGALCGVFGLITVHHQVFAEDENFYDGTTKIVGEDQTVRDTSAPLDGKSTAGNGVSVTQDTNAPLDGKSTAGAGVGINGSGGNGIEGANGSYKLANLTNSKTITELLLKIIDVLLVFALPLVVLYIMYAGYNFVIAQGNPSKISGAREALKFAVIGGVIIFGAKVIVDVIQNTITSF